MPFSLAQIGSALMNSKMLDDKGCAMPSALSSMKMLITCSSCGMESIQPMYLSAKSGNSFHSELEKRRLISSDSL